MTNVGVFRGVPPIDHRVQGLGSLLTRYYVGREMSHMSQTMLTLCIFESIRPRIVDFVVGSNVSLPFIHKIFSTCFLFGCFRAILAEKKDQKFLHLETMEHVGTGKSLKSRCGPAGEGEKIFKTQYF